MGQRSREVYLPAGKWIDLWDQSKTYEGPKTIKVEVPLDRIPAFVRLDKAALLPKALTEGL
jgi:alpha-glucosidase (family GH31 glycosyl hydrolase)